MLAAGRATRLGEVTDGHSKLLLRVGGLTLIERAVRMLLTSRLERVVVVVGFEGEAVAAVAARADPDRVHIVPAERWPEGNGQSLAAAESSLSGERRFVALIPNFETIVPASAATQDTPSSLFVPSPFSPTNIARSIVITPRRFPPSCPTPRSIAARSCSNPTSSSSSARRQPGTTTR